MTDKDKQVWETYTRGVKDARPRRKPKAAPIAGVAADKKQTQKEHRQTLTRLPLPIVLAPSVDLKLAATLERSREKALRQGDMAIDAKIDLHGMTQEQAFAALGRFMHRAVGAGLRQILVITGKGQGGEGVLRRNLQGWLGQLPEAAAILAVRPAAPHHGGGGAFYVLLRKIRGQGGGKSLELP